MRRLPRYAVFLLAAAAMIGCQPISQRSGRQFPDASYTRLWLAASAVAHRQWTVVSEDSTSGHLIAVAGDGGRDNLRPFEYRVHVAPNETGVRVDVRCWSSMFGRQVNLEKLYLHEVNEKYDFLSPEGGMR